MNFKFTEFDVQELEEGHDGDHETLHQRRDEDQCERDADDGVEDAETLAILAERRHVAIADGGDDRGAEEHGLPERPVALVGGVLGCVDASVASVHHQLQQFFQGLV